MSVGILVLALHLMKLSGVDKTTGCTFAPPFDPPPKVTYRWTGECVDHKAQGIGVLRSYHDMALSSTFYGQMQQGLPWIGVTEVEGGGWVADLYDNGQRVHTQDLEITLEAFRVATQAAQWASEKFHEQGNEPSARWYAAKAQQLRDQLED